MRFRFPSRLALVLLDGGWSMRFPHLARYRRGSKWIFRYGEAETPPRILLRLFGMYVAMQLRYGYDIHAPPESFVTNLDQVVAGAACPATTCVVSCVLAVFAIGHSGRRRA
jgi:hypothetical protein